MIQPTIGRVLWFHPTAAHPEAQPCPAIITQVFSNDVVTLACFDQNGIAYAAQKVALWQGEGERPAIGTPYAEWMPYQIGQAAKAVEPVEAEPEPVNA